MKKTINNPLVAFKYVIDNFPSYEKFFIKDIFLMLRSEIPTDTSGVTNRMEELRILFESFRTEYKTFPESWSIELEEIFNRLQEQKLLLELTPDTLKEYFEIDLKRYDKKLLAKYCHLWFTKCWIAHTTRKTFENAKTKSDTEGQVQELLKGLSEALTIERVQEPRLEGTLFDPDSYEGLEATIMKSGFQSLDLMLSSSGKASEGGFVRGGLYAFMTGPKGGKSLVLSNLMVRAIRNGYKIAIASFEMPKQDYFQRINCNLFDISRQEYDKTPVNDFLQKKESDWKNAHFRQFTNAHTPADIERWVLNLQQDTGEKIDMVYVDYINLLSNARGGKSDNTYVAVKQIAEDLRSAGLRNDWTTITVTQTNRAADGADEYSLKDVSESHGLAATVDALFGIIEQKNIPDQRKITLIASRRSGNVEPIYFNIDWTRWKLREIGKWQNEDMGLNQQYNLTGIF